MNYDEALQYIENITPLGFQLGLERIETLLLHLGSPQKNLKCIHVAGTNGKGSACTMLRNILTQSGYKTALYTSPHLTSYNERFDIDGCYITDSLFGEIAGIVADACKKMNAQNEGQPTVFEFLTAMAFYYFNMQKVDVVVLEVGLGGRFDATNVIPTPLLSLIMSISMDHMEYLGNDLDKIAMEKGGIIKENCPVVLYSQTSLVYNTIERICQQKNAPLYYTGNEEITIHKQNLFETVFSIQSSHYSFLNVIIHLLGDFQIRNCAAVLLSCSILQKQGLSSISEQTILKGIADSKWMGRLEVFNHSPLTVIDGAHNVEGIATLAANIPLYFSNKKITLILGMLGDKEYEKMAETLLPYVHQVILTEPLSNRKLDVSILEKILLPFGKMIYKEELIENAYQKAKEITDKSDVILAAGSLYMIGELRKIIIKNGGTKND